MCAEKSTENPTDMTRLTMEMESRATPHRAMRPTTPASVERTERETAAADRQEGIRHRETCYSRFCFVFSVFFCFVGEFGKITSAMATAATPTHCRVVGTTIRN